MKKIAIAIALITATGIASAASLTGGLFSAATAQSATGDSDFACIGPRRS